MANNLTFAAGFEDSFGTRLSPVTGCLTVLILPFIVLFIELFMFMLIEVWVTSNSFSLSSFFLLQQPKQMKYHIPCSGATYAIKPP